MCRSAMLDRDASGARWRGAVMNACACSGDEVALKARCSAQLAAMEEERAGCEWAIREGEKYHGDDDARMRVRDVLLWLVALPSNGWSVG